MQHNSDDAKVDVALARIKLKNQKLNFKHFLTN